MSFLKSLFSKRKEPDISYPNIFHSDNWQAAKFFQRLDALQKLENDYARQQGRSPKEIVPVKMGHINIRGFHAPGTDIIKINGQHLMDHPIEDGFNYMCVDTIIHEGRHAFQHSVANRNVIHDNKHEMEMWKENFTEGVYVSPTENNLESFMYRLQPVERDAYDYAHTEMNKIFGSIEKEFGKNKGLSEYLAKHHINDKIRNEKMAERKLGKDYLLAIDGQIHERYLDKKIDMERWNPGNTESIQRDQKEISHNEDRSNGPEREGMDLDL